MEELTSWAMVLVVLVVEMVLRGGGGFLPELFPFIRSGGWPCIFIFPFADTGAITALSIPCPLGKIRSPEGWQPFRLG